MFCLLALTGSICRAQENNAFSKQIVLSGASVIAASEICSASAELGEPIHAGSAYERAMVELDAGGEWKRNLLYIWEHPRIYDASGLHRQCGQRAHRDCKQQLIEKCGLGFFLGPRGSHFLRSRSAINIPVKAGVAYQIVIAAGAGNPARVVLNINQAPVIFSSATASASLGIAFEYLIEAGNGLAGSNAAGLPLGLRMNPFTGLIPGTATSTGTIPVQLTASNTAGAGTTMLMLKIGEIKAAEPALPVVTNAAAVNVALSASFSYTNAATQKALELRSGGLVSRCYFWLRHRVHWGVSFGNRHISYSDLGRQRAW